MAPFYLSLFIKQLTREHKPPLSASCADVTYLSEKIRSMTCSWPTDFVNTQGVSMYAVYHIHNTRLAY